MNSEGTLLCFEICEVLKPYPHIKQNKTKNLLPQNSSQCCQDDPCRATAILMSQLCLLVNDRPPPRQLGLLIVPEVGGRHEIYNQIPFFLKCCCNSALTAHGSGPWEGLGNIGRRKPREGAASLSLLRNHHLTG